jgi:hypothetical protein
MSDVLFEPFVGQYRAVSLDGVWIGPARQTCREAEDDALARGTVGKCWRYPLMKCDADGVWRAFTILTTRLLLAVFRDRMTGREELDDEPLHDGAGAPPIIWKSIPENGGWRREAFLSFEGEAGGPHRSDGSSIRWVSSRL